ncbi:MAG: phosphoribosyltransferase [Steroidobacteraceae bacterium]
MKIFADRIAAGKALVPLLSEHAGRADTIVLALPRGGVPVGFALAQALCLPLDVLVVRKLGVPGQPELAMGAIAAGGVKVLNPEIAHWLQGDAELIDAVVMREQQELERREHLYRSGRLPLDVTGKTVIVVDDGAATGATMRAAVQTLRHKQAARIIVALPTASSEACADLRQVADQVVCVDIPEPFTAVGRWYHEFDQTRDAQVIALLAEARAGNPVHATCKKTDLPENS